MQLHGKVVSPNRSGLDLNGSPELLINVKSGRITLTNTVINKLDKESLSIGFGYDPAEEQGSKAFMYITEEGCKVGKGGTVSSKWHASELKTAFSSHEGMENTITRFKLNIDLDNTVDYEGTTLYPISFKETLADLTRTKKDITTIAPVAEVEVFESEEDLKKVYPDAEPVAEGDLEPEGQAHAEEPATEGLG